MPPTPTRRHPDPLSAAGAVRAADRTCSDAEDRARLGASLGLRERLHHRQEFLTSITLRPCEVEKLLQSGDNRSTLRCTGDDDGSSTVKLQESLVSKHAKCPKHSIGVDAKHGSEVLGLRNSISGVSLSVGDGSANLRGNLIV